MCCLQYFLKMPTAQAVKAADLYSHSVWEDCPRPPELQANSLRMCQDDTGEYLHLLGNGIWNLVKAVWIPPYSYRAEKVPMLRDLRKTERTPQCSSGFQIEDLILFQCSLSHNLDYMTNFHI